MVDTIAGMSSGLLINIGMDMVGEIYIDFLIGVAASSIDRRLPHDIGENDFSAWESGFTQRPGSRQKTLELKIRI
jgi:hypothetical protein